MQRWFFLDSRKQKQRKLKKMSLKDPEPQVQPQKLSQEWLFTVSVPPMEPQEKIYITGSTPELGEWDYNKMSLLENIQGTDTWTKTINIPNTCDVFYRYAVCVTVGDNNEVVVRRWETNIKPRVIKENMLHPTTDMFGDYGDKQSVTTGWLTAHTVVQFKFCNNPLKMNGRFAGRLVNIKVTPVKLSLSTENYEDSSSQSLDSAEVELPAGVNVVVSTLHNDPDICKLKAQDQFGTEYKPNDILIFNVSAPSPSGLAYLIDFFSYSTRASSDDPPFHIGYTYVLPNMFKPSEGMLELPITCNIKHRPLGTVIIEYLIIAPMQEKLCSMQVSYAKYWDPSWTGLEVGHRGLGASFKTKE